MERIGILGEIEYWNHRGAVLEYNVASKKWSCGCSTVEGFMEHCVIDQMREEALSKMPKRVEFETKLYLDGCVTARNQSQYGDDVEECEFLISTDHLRYLTMVDDGFHDGQKVTVVITEVQE